MRRVIDFLLALAILAVLTPVILSYFPHASWIFNVLTHFRIQYLIGAVALFLASTLLRRWYHAFVCSLIILNCALFFPPHRGPSVSENAPRLTIMQFNRFYKSDATAPFVDYVRSLKNPPDLITVQEVTSKAIPSLDSLKDIYPYRYPVQRPINCDVMILSRTPFIKARLVDVGYRYMNSAGVRVVTLPEGFDRPVTLYSIHTKSPSSIVTTYSRSIQMRRMASVIGDDKRSPLILFTGDMNTSHFNRDFQDMLAISGLRHQYRGLWPSTTWPSRMMLPILKVPIDHILSNKHMTLIEQHSGPALGSDHNPLIATFAVNDLKHDE